MYRYVNVNYKPTFINEDFIMQFSGDKMDCNYYSQ